MGDRCTRQLPERRKTHHPSRLAACSTFLVWRVLVLRSIFLRLYVVACAVAASTRGRELRTAIILRLRRGSLAQTYEAV